MRFINLTDATNDEPVFVNASDISAIAESPRNHGTPGRRIYVNSSVVVVKETQEEILKLVSGCLESLRQEAEALEKKRVSDAAFLMSISRVAEHRDEIPGPKKSARSKSKPEKDDKPEANE